MILSTALDAYYLADAFKQDKNSLERQFGDAFGFSPTDQVVYFIIDLLIKGMYFYVSYKASKDPSMGATYVKVLSNNSKPGAAKGSTLSRG